MIAAYSKDALTEDRYAIFLRSAGQPLRLRLRNPSFWLAVIAALDMWGSGRYRRILLRSVLLSFVVPLRTKGSKQN